MTRFGLQTWGSEGDVQPFMALAETLAQRGHGVRLVITTQADRTYRAPAGVEIERVGPPLTKADGDALLERVVALRSPMDQAKLILRAGFEPAVPAMLGAAKDLAGSCDVVVRHHFLHMTQAACLAEHTPEVSVFLSPDLVPTAEHPPSGMPSLGPLNRASWWVAGRAIHSIFGPSAAKVRAELGLPRPDRTIGGTWNSEHLNLVAVSPTLWPRPGDWPAHVALTGFWRGPLTETAMAEPVRRFLDAGEAPVYCTFGSHSPAAEGPRRETSALVIAACRAVGRRLILQRPPGPDDDLDHDVLSVERAPHAVVFPECAAVMHHGGAGTTQTALQAGVPSVVVPHLADQFFWAGRLTALKVGAAVRHRRGLRAGRLAASLRRVLTDGEARERAARLGHALVEETGTTEAAERLEALAHRHGSV